MPSLYLRTDEQKALLRAARELEVPENYLIRLAIRKMVHLPIGEHGESQWSHVSTMFSTMFSTIDRDAG